MTKDLFNYYHMEDFIEDTQSFGTNYTDTQNQVIEIPGAVANQNVSVINSPVHSWLLQFMFGLVVDMNNYIFPVSISIPRSFLPLSHQFLFNFDSGEDALIIKFDQLNESSPLQIEVTQPSVGENFPGSIVIQEIVRKFIAKTLQVKKYYRSAPFVFPNEKVSPKPEYVNLLKEKGYNELQSEKALSNCQNDITKSIQLLRKGKYDSSNQLDVSTIVSYDTNPVIYLVMEILDVILGLENHCCLCGDQIPHVIKPTPCGKPLCRSQFSTFKLGASLTNEIRRDVRVADFLFTIFVSAVGQKYLIPPPPTLARESLQDFKDSQDQSEAIRKAYDKNDNVEVPLNHDPKYLEEIIKDIQSFTTLAEFQNDEELKQEIKDKAFNLIQFVLLTNRSQMIYLPPDRGLPLFNGECEQFMCIQSSPERESIFQQLKAKHGSFYLWHGSILDKWHSIIRNGLINTSRVKGMVINGNVHGPGIYFASNSSTSLGYSIFDQNKWSNSLLNKEFNVIALCEVIKLPLNQNLKIDVQVKNCFTGQLETKTLDGFLNDNRSCYTLTMEEACVVRFLFVNFNKNIDSKQVNPNMVPTIDSIIDNIITEKMKK